jgi:lipoprotein-anchoring transpeptidase ErfK/SrfK
MKAKTDNGAHSKAKASLVKLPRSYFIVWAVFIGLGAVVALFSLTYHDRALPNTYVGSTAVGNMTKAQIKQVVQDEANQLKVTFKKDKTILTASAKDLGVSIDVDSTVRQAFLARRGANVAQNLNLLQNRNVPLVYHNDAGVLKAYIAAHFPDLTIDSQDAQVVFNDAAHVFEVKPSAPGRGFDIKRFEAALPDLAKNPRLTVLPLQTVPVAPLIDNKAAQTAADYANKIIQLKLDFVQKGASVKTASPADIASWAYFTPDPSAGKIAVAFDRSHVLQFLSNDVAGQIASLPVDRKVAVDTSTGEQSVIQQGHIGQQLKEIDKLADAVMDSLAGNKPLSQEVSVEEAPFKTVTISGDGKWIEVDLSHQTTTLYLGNVPIKTFLISSGRAATPTELGTFHVYRKYTSTTMTGTILGEYYYVPNIPWVSYFDDGEAFHGTYWHHNFGHPMSHGCINMTIPDAKILYDFAPVGTKVVVHN